MMEMLYMLADVLSLEWVAGIRIVKHLASISLGDPDIFFLIYGEVMAPSGVKES